MVLIVVGASAPVVGATPPGRADVVVAGVLVPLPRPFASVLESFELPHPASATATAPVARAIAVTRLITCVPR